MRVVLLLAFLVAALCTLDCGGSQRPPEDYLRVLCAPGAENARAVAHMAARAACRDEPCRNAADVAFDVERAAAQAYCAKMPTPVEPLGPIDGGAGGSPALVAPPPQYGNKIVSEERRGCGIDRSCEDYALHRSEFPWSVR